MAFAQAFQKRREYTQKLMMQGFDDVDILMPFFRDHNSADIKEICGYFWSEEYGYILELSPRSGHIANECMFSIFDEILDFLGDAAAFNKMDIGKALAEFLENSGFAGINVRSDSNDKSAHIYASKDMYEYIFYLERRWPEKQICSDEDDSADEDYEPFEYETDEVNSYFDEFKEIFEQEVKGETYQFQLSPDLTRLSAVIRQNWDNHYLTVRLCNSDLTLENWIFKNIVCYWLEAEFSQNCFLENLKDHRFHLSLGDRGKIEAYKEGLKFEIEVSSKRIIDFDNMDGHAFEHFCAEILSFYGFNNVQVTQGSGDQGVDIIAYKDDIKYGIQCKCYASDIGNRAVQEVFAGKAFYQCHVGVVLTNRYFTKSAIELASRNGVILWNRDKLLQMLEQYNARKADKEGL